MARLELCAQGIHCFACRSLVNVRQHAVNECRTRACEHHASKAPGKTEVLEIALTRTARMLEKIAVDDSGSHGRILVRTCGHNATPECFGTGREGCADCYRVLGTKLSPVVFPLLTLV